MKNGPALASSMTKSASTQTFYTILFLADRNLVQDAYRAYAYFRWVDDRLDADQGSQPERLAFLSRQKSLLEACYRRESIPSACPEERMMVDLIKNDPDHHPGLRAYFQNMMAVMEFDANRRGQLITEVALNRYTYNLASAVTEAMHHFVGHDCQSPADITRYLAVTAAHITHMLRDTVDDTRAGYFNIPREVLEAGKIKPQDYTSRAYRSWVRGRVQLARRYFQAGREYLHRVANLRCRLAGFAYMERFTRLLDAIEGDDFMLRPVYEGLKGWGKGWQVGWQVLASAFRLDTGNPRPMTASRPEGTP